MKKTIILTIFVLMLGITISNPSIVYADNQGQLGASCYPARTSVNIGDSVEWRVFTYGGDGNYSITWSGSNGLSGSGLSATTKYETSGSKTASISVTSAGQTVNQNCGSVIVGSYSSSNSNDYSVNNYYYNTNIYTPLEASCYASYSSGNTGEAVMWRAVTSGGNGTNNIRWSGTDGLSGTGETVYKNYEFGGIKSASITVYSNGQTIVRNCNTVQIYGLTNNNDNSTTTENYYGPLTVSCSVDSSFSPVGNIVTWKAYPLGGNGGYLYTWSGTDNITGNGNPVRYVYNSPGTKTASVTVNSNNQSVTKTCKNEIMIGVPTVYTPPPTYNTPEYNPPVYNPNPPTYNTPDPVLESINNGTYSDTEVEEKVIPEPEVKTDNSITSYFSFSNVPWIWVLVMVILVMFFMFIYLFFNNKKI